MLSEEQKLQIKMSMNDKWHLVKLTHVWPDGHLINQMAHALIERNAELLSLREQLAELKALPPFGQIVLSDYDSDGTRTARIVCLHDQADWDNFQDGTLLFTAAKPSDSVTLPAPANYEDYGPMVSLEKTMAALALCGIEYTVKK